MRFGAVLGLVMWLAACSPAYNWRQVSHEAAPARILMPCKPERALRSVPLMESNGPLVELSMLSCDVKGKRFAWAALRLPPGVEAEPVLQAWRRATWASLKQTVPSGEGVPPDWVRAQTPASAGLQERWRGPARDHRGQTLQAHVLWLESAGWMHQVAVYAVEADSEVVETFFGSYVAR